MRRISLSALRRLTFSALSTNQAEEYIFSYNRKAEGYFRLLILFMKKK